MTYYDSSDDDVGSTQSASVIKDCLKDDPALGIHQDQQSSDLLIETDTQNWSDREYVLNALKKDGMKLAQVDSKLRYEPAIIQMALSSNGLALGLLPVHLRDYQNSDMAVANNGMALQHATKHIGSIAIVKLAVSNNGLALQFANRSMKKNEEIIRAALKNDGRALEFAAEDYRNDLEICYLAVSQNGMALKFANERLRHDANLVLRAINGTEYFVDGKAIEVPEDMVLHPDADALQFASIPLRRNSDIVSAAISRDPSAERFRINPSPNQDRKKLTKRHSCPQNTTLPLESFLKSRSKSSKVGRFSLERCSSLSSTDC
jgi:hypothetical protein